MAQTGTRLTDPQTSATGPAGDPTPRARKGRGSMAAMFTDFVPWIIYWILIGNVSFRVAILVAFGAALLVFLRPVLGGERPKVLEIGSLVTFAALVVVGFVSSDHFLERWIQPLTNGAIFLIALTSVVVHRPFTLEYARESVEPDVADQPGFYLVNLVITWVWVGVFLVMTVSSLIPPLTEGAATIRDAGDTTSIVGYWVVPFTVLGLGAVFSGWFPDWFVARLDAPHPDPAAAAAAATHPTPVPLDLEPATGPGGLRFDLPAVELPADAPLAFAVAGAAPGAHLAVRAETDDADGHRWATEAVLRAGADGRVEATADPVDGPWSEGDADAFVWAMRPVDGAAVDLFAPPTEPRVLRLSARPVGDPGDGAAVAGVRRLPTGPGVTTRDLVEGDVVARLHLPAGSGPHPAVLLLPGSEGGLDSQGALAGLLASRGYAAMVAATIGAPGLQSTVDEVPLERIGRSADLLRAQPEVDAARLAGYSLSKGAEGLLCAAGLLDGLGLTAIAAVSPSSVAWQAIGDGGPLPDHSSWTLGGRPVPFAPLDGERLMGQLFRTVMHREAERHHLTSGGRPAALRLVSAYSLVSAHQVPDARIPVERIAAPLLLVAGSDDQLWPSAAMAGAIAEGRRAAGVGAADRVLVHPGAGHLIRQPLIPTTGLATDGIAFGGTAGPLAAAQRRTWDELLAFLAAHLGAAGSPPR